MAKNSPDSLYQAWRDNPNDETLAALYGVILANAKRAVRAYMGWEDEQLAEDIALDTLASLPRFIPRRPFVVWMQCVARNVCREASRKRIRNSGAMPESTYVPPLYRVLDVCRFAERASHSEKRLLACLMRGESGHEMSSKFGITQMAVRARIYLFRKKILAALG